MLRKWSDNPMTAPSDGNAMAFETVTVSRSYEQVVDQIRDQIRSGRLVRGERLPSERELGASFGVGRGVIREAVKVLGAMGLVEARQGSGLFVRDDPLPSISRAFVLSVEPKREALGRLFEFRQALESLAARAAAERRTPTQALEIQRAAEASARAESDPNSPDFAAADTRFHAAVRSAADNPYLDAMLTAVRETQNDVVHLFIDIPGSVAVAADHHCRVAAAIAAQDGPAAAAAMDEHIAYTADAVASVLRQATAEEEGGAPRPS